MYSMPMKNDRRHAARFAGALLALAAMAVVAAQAPGRHPVSGRQFAGVMGFQGAPWLERPEREMEEEPDKALDVIRLAKGSAVADVGAGSGYITARMAS